MLDDCFGIEDPKVPHVVAAKRLALFLNNILRNNFRISVRKIYGAQVTVLEVENKKYVSRVSADSSIGHWIPGAITERFGKEIYTTDIHNNPV